MEINMFQNLKWSAALAVSCASALAMFAPSASAAEKPASPEYGVDDAILLTPFGGRTAFSPDGKKIAFVGKTYADAYEIDIATRKVRNLTHNIPHQGIMRIQERDRLSLELYDAAVR